MKIFKDNELLKEFVNFYFKQKNLEFPSSSVISQKLNCSIGKIRRYTELFIECEFLYKDNKKIYIYKTKHDFKSNFKTIKLNNMIIFKGENYTIVFDEFELYEVVPDYDFKKECKIEDIVFWLFLFTAKYTVSVKKEIYIKNNKIWILKKCYCNKLSKVIYSCEFTQEKEVIKLYNE